MDLFSYNQYSYAQKELLEEARRTDEFFERVANFASINNLEDAQNLARKILPTNNEITRIYVGNAKCTVINKPNMLRICIDSEKRFICYNFS